MALTKPLAACANANGPVYALADSDSQRIVYVELIFHNFFFDLDYTASYLSFQISLLYSAMVLSEEKNPAFAILTSIIFLHFF